MQIGADDFKNIKSRAKQLDDGFEGFRKKGADIQKFVCPWRGRFLSGDSEQEDRGELYDDSSIHNTAIFQALNTAAAGIKSGISPSSGKWFGISSEDEKLSELGAPAHWLSHVEKLFYTIFQRSNIYGSLHEIYTEEIAFGTGNGIGVPDYENVIRMRPFSFGECRVGHDHRRVVNAFTRRFYMNAGQLVSQFGKENVGNRVREAYAAGRLETKFLCRLLVEPNDDRANIKDALGRDYRAIYWIEGAEANEILGVRGFGEFPLISGAWESVGGQVYGIGPGHMNLRNAKRLQKLEEDSLQQLALHTKPPLYSDAANTDTLINAGPWGVTRGNDGAATTKSGIRPLYEVRPNTQELEYKIERTEKAIRDGFYNNVFLMISNSVDAQKTATEVARMMEEKYSVLGPVIERSQAMLGQLIKLTFAYAQDAGLIPEAPPELQGSELKIEYVSILARAQKIAGLQAISETMAFVGQASELWPEARHKFDALQAIDEVAQVNGSPPSVIRSDDEVDALMEAERQQQAAAQAAQAGMMAVEGASKLKGVEVGGRSAVDVLAGGA